MNSPTGQDEVLGLGIGILAADYLRGLALSLCSADSSSTCGGCWRKHRLARTAGTEQPWWSALVYWVCGLFLAALAICAAVRVREPGAWRRSSALARESRKRMTS